MTRREWLLAALAAAVAVAGIWTWRSVLFGAGTWGAGGNMVAWVICGGIGFANVRARDKAHHAAAMLLAKTHHAERMYQADAHHQEAMAQAAEHHAAVRQHLDQHGAAIAALRDGAR
jgi:ribosomal protein S11